MLHVSHIVKPSQDVLSCSSDIAFNSHCLFISWFGFLSQVVLIWGFWFQFLPEVWLEDQYHVLLLL